MKKHLKIAITGACGQVAYSILFRLASGAVFGHDTEITLQLLDLEQFLPKLRGVQMELEDCAFPLLKNIVVTADVNEAMRDINWAVLIGAMPRSAGMERADLLKINAAIFKTQALAINKYANSDARILVVGNPCNTNCLIAMRHAPEIPRDHFYALMRLDENRAKIQLANKARAAIYEVSNLVVWGNHSATQFPDFYNAKILDKNVPEIITDANWLQTEFLNNVRQRGAEIIKVKGTSSAASAANGVIDCLRDLVKETLPNQNYSLACCSNGEYDVDAGLVFGFPCRTVNGEAKIIANISHNTFAKEQLQKTLAELRSERDAVKNLGLI